MNGSREFSKKKGINNIIEELKVIFIGLDNAGKSSIILTMLREISKITIIKATKGAQRRVYKFLGRNISEWDLGGHEMYRNKYLKEPDLFFERTDIAIYVIDIQDKQRMFKSLNYLSQITKQFLFLKIEPTIYIFFHKYDPDFIDDAQSELKYRIQSLENKIKNIPNYSNFAFYTTSIFNLATVFNAISEILLIKFPNSEIIKGTIKDFANEIQADGLMIVDDNSLMIGSYYENNSIKEILNSIAPYLLKVNDMFDRTQDMKFHLEDQIVIHKFGKYFLFKKFLLKEGAPNYYLICSKEDLNFNEEIYKSFVKKFMEIIYL